MSRAVTLSGYTVLAVAAFALQIAGVAGRRTATLGDAVTRLTKHPAGRVLLLAGWLWAGWHMFVRRG